jgi:hypothetical protein
MGQVATDITISSGHSAGHLPRYHILSYVRMHIHFRNVTLNYSEVEHDQEICDRSLWSHVQEFVSTFDPDTGGYS